MAYYEGTINDLGCNNGNNGWSDWSWIIGLALVGGLFGNGGFGFGGGYGGGRDGFYGYPYASPATVQDVASGFSTSEIMSDLNDILLGQASMQNFINQGFAGLNQTVTTGFAGVNNAICTLGYQQAQLVNGLSTQLAQCCCDTRAAIADVKYANERNTCDIIRAGQDNTRAILDYLTGEKISSLQAENAGLKAQISNDRQSAYIVSQLREPCPVPSYVVQPPVKVTFPTDCCGNFTGFGGCGCN